MRWILPAVLATVLAGCSPPGPMTEFVLEPTPDFDATGATSSSLPDAGNLLRTRLARATGLPERAIQVEVVDLDQRLQIVVPASARDSARPVLIDAARSGNGLAFHLVHEGDPAVASRIREGDVVAGFALFPTRSGEPAEVAAQINPALAGMVVESALVRHSQRGFELHVRLDAEGGRKMHALTTASTGKRVAIVWDGEVLTSPTVNEPFGADFVISGDFEREEIDAIATALENGPLPVPLQIASEATSSD